MNLHNKRKLGYFLHIFMTIMLFMSLYGYMSKKMPLSILIISGLLYIGTLFLRYRILSKNFYVQKYPKSKTITIISRILPIASFFILLYFPNNFGINSLLAGLVFSGNTIIDEKYSKYYTYEEYEEYMKKKNKKNNNKANKANKA